MLRSLGGIAVIAVVACGSPTGPVELTTTPEQSIRMVNRTSEPIYYFAIEANAAALANWAVCSNPATCPQIRSGESRLIPFSEIALYTSGAEAALVYWWHLRPASGGTFAPDSVRAVRVALTRPQEGALRLEATIGRSTIGFGDTTSIVVRLRNVSSDSIVLRFNDSCQVLPYITTRRADQVIYPGGGSWGCYLVLTRLALGPGAENVTTVLVRGGPNASSPGVPLLPGEYRAYARLEHPDFPLRSATITFRID